MHLAFLIACVNPQVRLTKACRYPKMDPDFYKPNLDLVALKFCNTCGAVNAFP